MRKLKFSQFPIAGLWLLKRKGRYFFWGLYNRLSGSLKFEKIGKGVKFNGPVRVEKPFSKICVGDYSRIGINCYFLAGSSGSIIIGKNVSINDNCYITSLYEIEIGDNSRIAENVSIRDYDHKFSNITVPIRTQGFHGAPIKIGEDVWIGRGVMVASGVTIGKGCIVGANAVVTKNLPDYSVAVGVPARIIKNRLTMSNSFPD